MSAKSEIQAQVDVELRRLAEAIWKRGEIDYACGCLSPEQHRAVCKYYKATHYDRHWAEIGKYVKLNFYQAPYYGAALQDEDMKFVGEATLDVGQGVTS